MIYAYINKREEIPFLIWLEKIKKKDQSIYNKSIKMLEMMNDDTLPLVRPNVKKTPIHRTGFNNLYKIRLGKYRLLFLVDNHNYYLLHTLRKKTNQTPQKDFDQAVRELNSKSFKRIDNMKKGSN